MKSKYQHIIFPHKIIEEKFFYNVTDIFGYRHWRKKKWPNTSGFHSGIDIGTKGRIGVEVYTPYDGVVSKISRSSKDAGHYITIKHDNVFSTRYLHLQDITVNINQAVFAGQLIGHTGNTGHSTGPHLHFEVRINDKPVDPAPYLYGFALEDGKGSGNIIKFHPNKKVSFGEGKYFTSELDEQSTEIKNEKQKVDIEEKYASGIWQIVKTIIDPEVAQKQINDATISMMQGSLFNFFEKVIQKPFVEFFGDTYGDQYYFIVRKPPFTEKAFKSLFTVEIDNADVISEDLSFDNEHIYSWYQLTPNGNYIGGQDLIFQLLQAVYFPEYGEIWGSKPLTIVSNYITFIKETSEIQLQAALQDLKFLIDIHSYLPFTRKGTLTINHNRRIKKGMRVLHKATNEYFYVDSVSHTINQSNGIIDATTTIEVSRGMKRKYVDVEITDDETLSYFNLINFGNTPKHTHSTAKTIPNDINFNIDRTVAYFNEDKYTFDEDDIRDDKITDLKTAKILYKNELRITNEMYQNNFQNSKKIAEFLFKYKNVKLVLYGLTNSNGSKAYNLKLSKRRANTIKELVIDYYTRIGGKKADAKARLIIKAEGISPDNNDSAIGKLLNRRVDVYLKEEFDKKVNKKEKPEKLKTPKDGKWRVNKKVFTFFLRKQQFFNSLNIDEI